MAVPFPRSRENASYAWEARAAEQKPRRARMGPSKAKLVSGRVLRKSAGGGPQGARLLFFGGSGLPPVPKERKLR
eukprot:scaffold19100_cov36-Phaeocystis_antarctica.AAC.1